jgi:hypothetical protein
MTSATTLQLNKTSQSTLLMESLYMTSATTLQLNKTSQSTLQMESLYMTSATSLKLNMTSQTTLFMTSLQFCINQEECAWMLIICELDVQTNL